LLIFFKKEALSFCSFLKKRTKKLLDICAELYSAKSVVGGGGVTIPLRIMTLPFNLIAPDGP